jgi:GNAT superfamily N-acetyltransferase
MNPNDKNKYSIRKANIQTLVSHHCMMFREIRELQGKKIDDTSYKEMEEADTKKLSEGFLKELCHAWIVEDENRKIVANGAISICNWVPIPENPNYIMAYLHSMYTEKEHRENGLATKIIEEARDFCCQNNISAIMLGASDAGRHVYEKVGFKPVPSFMHLLI